MLTVALLYSNAEKILLCGCGRFGDSFFVEFSGYDSGADINRDSDVNSGKSCFVIKHKDTEAVENKARYSINEKKEYRKISEEKIYT